MEFNTYILHSATINKYYVGSTSESVDKRLEKHLRNHKGFTGKAKDWNIVYPESHSSLNDARKRELQIKSWKSRIQIEKLIGLEHPDYIGRVAFESSSYHEGLQIVKAFFFVFISS